MERNQLFQSARHWYPVFAAILSSILNFIAFMVGIEWKSEAILQIGLLAIGGTMALSILVIYILYRIGKSSYVEEHTIIQSTDSYKILNNNHAIYQRTVMVRVNKSTPFIILYPPTADGEVQGYRAFKVDNPEVEYEVHKQRICGRKALYLSIGRPLKKGEILEGICYECQLINSFHDESEGVSVTSDPGQEKCMITVSLPPNTPPVSLQADWFVSSGQNPDAIYHGNIDIFQTADGSFMINQDFSHYLTNRPDLKCSINWKWKPIQEPVIVN